MPKLEYDPKVIKYPASTTRHRLCSFSKNKTWNNWRDYDDTTLSETTKEMMKAYLLGINHQKGRPSGNVVMLHVCDKGPGLG